MKLILKLVSAEKSPARAKANHERCCTAAGRGELAYTCANIYAAHTQKAKTKLCALICMRCPNQTRWSQASNAEHIPVALQC